VNNIDDDDLRPEYDFKALGTGVRGKYARRISRSTNVVTIDEDLVEAFPNAKAVNDALRSLLKKQRAALRRRD
jgi:hypothetical protein